MRELRAKLRNDELAKSNKSARAEKEANRAKHTNYKRNDDHIGKHRSEGGNELIAKACKVRFRWPQNGPPTSNNSAFRAKHNTTLQNGFETQGQSFAWRRQRSFGNPYNI